MSGAEGRVHANDEEYDVDHDDGLDGDGGRRPALRGGTPADGLNIRIDHLEVVASKRPVLPAVGEKQV